MTAVWRTSGANAKSQKLLSYMEHYVNICRPSNQEEPMLIIDPSILVAVAAIITASSALVWSFRRKP